MKVFVTVGTTPFYTLVNQVEQIAKQRKDEFVVQYGPSGKAADSVESFAFAIDIDPYYKKADVIVSHAGAGSVFRLLETGKKLIIVPNLERADDHQLDLAQYLERNQFCAVCYDVRLLGRKLDTIAGESFRRYTYERFSGFAEIRRHLGLDRS